MPPPPYQALWEQRFKLVSGRCYFVLRQHDKLKTDVRHHVRSLTRWFWSEKSLGTTGAVSSSPYMRPVAATIWDERFDATGSVINQPITKLLFERIAREHELSRHWLSGYLAALALLDILHGLMGTRPQDLDALEGFGGPYEQGGPDWTAFELDDERHTMVENILGKAEECLFKADAFEEAARQGSIGSTPLDSRWEPPVLQYLETHIDEIERLRRPSGKINLSKLARLLTSILEARHGIKLPSERTIVNRLKNLLAEAGILETRG